MNEMNVMMRRANVAVLFLVLALGMGNVVSTMQKASAQPAGATCGNQQGTKNPCDETETHTITPVCYYRAGYYGGSGWCCGYDRANWICNGVPNGSVDYFRSIGTSCATMGPGQICT